MNNVIAVDVPRVDGLTIELTWPATIKLAGIVTKREPSLELSGFFKSIHNDALARTLPEVVVDLSGLTFVNSSAIRLFIDWASWVKNTPSRRYVLRFKTNRQYTWQQTAFTALTSLMNDVLIVESVN